jgi:2-keto-3-deoxy-L-rhamnonate aldolase RhmA
MNWSFNYIAITNQPEKAQIFSNCGIQQIMIDTEKIGKVERQGHKDTIISNHSLNDIKILKELNLDSEIICRVNPFNDNSFKEIDIAIDNGADIIMIPMITVMDNYKSMVDSIGDRVKVLPLIETPYSFFKLSEILEYSALTQIHFGLNDLCISLGMRNLFEVLISQTFQNITKKVKVDIKGIGGIGDPQKRQKVSPIALLNGYMKCDSNCVILSRNFFMNSLENEHIIRSLKIFEKAIVAGYNSLIDHELSNQVQRM